MENRQDDQEFEFKFEKARGQFRSKWGDISEEELGRVGHHQEELVRLLQEYYGFSREKAERALKSWLDRAEGAPPCETVWNQVQGRWRELKGHFLESYGEATDDEFVASEGQRDLLSGMIQKVYNVSKGEALEMVDDWAYEAFDGTTKVHQE